ADTGLGIESAAHTFGLDFVPLMQEQYWLVCLSSALETPAVQQLRASLSASPWLDELQGLPGYTPDAGCGQVQSLRRTLPWWD
ncbi:MAG: substrate-binding domain-containing protein, partial [Limnohabitans sp.]